MSGFASGIQHLSEQASRYAAIGGVAASATSLGSRVIFKWARWPSARAHRSIQATIRLIGFQSAGLIFASDLVGGLAMREQQQLVNDVGPGTFQTGPILLDSDPTLFDSFKAYAYQAGARMSAGKD